MRAKKDLQYLTLSTLLASVITILLFQFSLLNRIELISKDLLFIIRPKLATSPEIVFVDMNEASIDQIGRWPWPRSWHAALLTALKDFNAKAIMFDVFFSEPSDPVDDQAFAEAIKNAGNVYIPFAFEKDECLRIKSINENIPEIANAVKGTGFINFEPDSDGALRKGPILVSFKGKEYFYISLKLALDLLGVKDQDVSIRFHRIVAKKDNKPVLSIPLDDENEAVINWAGKWNQTFKHYSYIDVLHAYSLYKDSEDYKKILDLNLFKDKIIIIGLTATGLWDIRPNPLEPLYPAVGTHANLINSILMEEFIIPIPRFFQMLLIVLFTLVSTLIIFRYKFVKGFVYFTFLTLIYLFTAFTLFLKFNISLSMVYPPVGAFLSLLMVNYYQETLVKKELERLNELSTTDGLTNLKIMRHFNALSETFFREAKGKGRSLFIIMMDIDNFKHINDTYGHLVGDLALKEVSNIIKRNCRKLDISARYGGEEFIIMTLDTPKDGVLALAERIRHDIEKNTIHGPKVTFNFTISIGVSSYQDADNAIEDIIKRADAALYTAKREGKNRVVFG